MRLKELTDTRQAKAPRQEGSWLCVRKKPSKHFKEKGQRFIKYRRMELEAFSHKEAVSPLR